MDSDKKGKSWVGNIYNQFEAICQDVDDFMTKETVRYVENQVHNVGASVKRFYSDVHDKLPPLGKNVKLQETSTTAEQVNVRDYTESVTVTGPTPTCVTEDQLVVEQGSFDPLIANESTPSGHHAAQITKLCLTDSSHEKQSDLPSGKCGDPVIWNGTDYGFEDYITPKNADKKIYGTCIDHKNSLPPMVASPAISISDAEISASFNPLRANESTPSGHHAAQITKLSLTDPSQETTTDLPSEKYGDAIIWNSADYGFEDYITPKNADKIYGTCIDPKNSMPPMAASPAISISDAEISASFDLLKANGSTPSGHHASHITKLRSTDPSQETTTDLPSEKYGDAIIRNGADYGFEDFITPKNADKKIYGIYFDHKNSMSPMGASPAISISDAEISAIRKEMFDGFSDDKESQSNISTEGWLFDQLLPMVESPNSNEVKAHEENSLAMDPLLFSACDAGQKALNEDGILCDSFPPTEDACVDVSSTVQSTELVFSYFSCDDDEEGERGVVSSTCSASPRASNIVEFISEDFAQKCVNICSDHIESDGHVCTSFTPSTTTMAYEKVAMDMLPLVDSNDVNSSATSESGSITSSSQSRHGHCHEDAHSKFDLSPSEIAHCLSHAKNSVEFGVDAAACEMETIDFSNNVNHDEKNHFLNCNFAHPTSHGRRNFRYYKNLIQDAFASRKRLSKEYEHLGILYGDIDMESRHNFELSSLHSFPKSVNEARTQSLDMSECDWELL